MKILVTGVCGQLGYDVMLELMRRGHDVVGTDIGNCSAFKKYIQCDLTKMDEVEKLVKISKFDVVIHCAAWTAVDRAEDNKEIVYAINSLAAKYIAEAAKIVNAKIVYISTDYVFDGKGEKPFEVDSPKCGLSTYGRTKSIGEDFVIESNNRHFIVRTSGVFGKNGNNFVKTMLKIATSGKKEINVVNDQIVSVTYTKDLAFFIGNLIETEKYGIYHATNQGYLSWYDFAKEIYSLSNIEMIVNGVSTEEYKKSVPGQTDRPKNSRLSYKSLDDSGFARLPNYLDALERYLKELEILK